MEIEVYAQAKRFIAHSLEELDLILKHFKGWRQIVKCPRCSGSMYPVAVVKAKGKLAQKWVCSKCGFSIELTSR